MKVYKIKNIDSFDKENYNTFMTSTNINDIEKKLSINLGMLLNSSIRKSIADLEVGKAICINSFMIELQEVSDGHSSKPNSEDVFTKVDIDEEVSTSKKCNVRYWDDIESIVQTALEDVAGGAGVILEDWGDFDLIKETTEFMTKSIEARFGVKFPFVDENY